MVKVKRGSIIVLIAFILLLSTAYMGFAAIQQAKLLAPATSNWSENSSIRFNCTGNLTKSTEYLGNTTLVIWNTTASPATVYLNTTNTSNSSPGINNFTATFLVNNIPNQRGLNYSWNCYMRINASFTAANTTFNVTNNTFGIDTTAPTVNLESPINYQEDTSNTMTFVFNTTDASSDIENCTLYLNSKRNDTNTTYHDGNVNGSFRIALNSTFQKRDLNWYVHCMDNLTKEGNSTVRFVHTIPEAASTTSSSGPSSSSSSTTINIGTLDGLGANGVTKEVNSGKR